MSVVTTIFRPNSVGADIAFSAPLGFRRATAGCVFQGNDGEVISFKSNETDSDPSYFDQTVMAVGAARSISPQNDKRWRGMLRFVLRESTITTSSIVSGPTPAIEDWPRVSAARFKFFNGDYGSAEGGIPIVIIQSPLLVRVGRGLYTPTGANERPFGRNGTEAGASFGASNSFGILEATLAWADWGTPDRTLRTLTLSETAIAQFLRTIDSSANDYLDIALIVQQEGVDGVNFKREIGAWEPNPPTLEIDFETIDSEHIVDVFRPGHSVDVERPAHETSVSRPAHEVGIERPTHEVSVSRPAHEISITRGS